jgi:AraC family cel operon transcriptional repressor
MAVKLTLKQFTTDPSHRYVALIEKHEQLQAMHTHDYFELFLVKEGKAYHIVNNTTQLLKKGSVVFMRPNDFHCYSHMSDDFVIVNILIDGHTIDSLFSYLGSGYSLEKFMSSSLPPKSSLSEREFECVLQDLEQLVLSKNILKDQSETFFRISFLKIFTMCYPLIGAIQNSNIPEWLRWVVLEMMKKENFTEGLPAMVRLSTRSYEHLARTCRLYLNKTPTEIINELRIDYVTKEIINTEDTIITIALDSGFQNLSHFYHLFKKYYGMSPTTFRETYTKDQINLPPLQFNYTIVKQNIPIGIDFLSNE